MACQRRRIWALVRSHSIEWRRSQGCNQAVATPTAEFNRTRRAVEAISLKSWRSAAGEYGSTGLLPSPWRLHRATPRSSATAPQGALRARWRPVVPSHAYDRWPALASRRKQRVEIGIKSDTNSLLRPGSVQNFCIFSTAHPDFGNMRDVPARLSKQNAS